MVRRRAVPGEGMRGRVMKMSKCRVYKRNTKTHSRARKPEYPIRRESDRT